VQDRYLSRVEQIPAGQACHGARLRLQEISERLNHSVHPNPNGASPNRHIPGKKAGRRSQAGCPRILPRILPAPDMLHGLI
jgi:hypothetical protein